MSEILSYQDPQLIPSSVYESDDVTAGECYETCTHRGACRRMLEMEVENHYGDAVGEHDSDWFGDHLECADCDEWAEAL